MYNNPIPFQPEIKRQIQEYEEKGLITPSFSPYQANVWLVKKKLNASGKEKWRPEKANFLLPNIKVILCRLEKAKFLSYFDIANGFYQVAVKEKGCKKTSFSTLK